jgi:hypothetical protein
MVKQLFLIRPLNTKMYSALTYHSDVLAGKLDANTMQCIREYCRRWRARSIFQVLLMYRAARQQDLVYFSQQVSCSAY